MRLIDHAQEAGTHHVHLDGTNLPSGVYLYSLEAGPHRLSRSVVLMR